MQPPQGIKDSGAIHTDPPAGNTKKIVNMYYNEDTGLPEFEVEA